MSDDLNEEAFRIVEEATDDSRECPQCGKRMERRERQKSEEKFGGGTVIKTVVYFACSNCGYEAHVSD